MGAMQIGYGAYRHPVGWSNVVNFEARVNRSPRGFRTTTTIRADVAGDIVLQPGEDEYDLTTYIQQMEAAYLNDGLDWALYHTNGSPTAHYLQSSSADSLTGNQIIYKSFPASHGGEYVTGRSFRYMIENTFETAVTPLLYYTESITQTGDAGPIVDWQQADRFNPAFPIYRAASSYQTTVQEGIAVTNTAYFSVPSPLLPRPYLIGQASQVIREHPKRYPQGYQEYVVKWKYTYITPYDFNTALPTIR